MSIFSLMLTACVNTPPFAERSFDDDAHAQAYIRAHFIESGLPVEIEYEDGNKTGFITVQSVTEGEVTSTDGTKWSSKNVRALRWISTVDMKGCMDMKNVLHPSCAGAF